MLEVFVEEVERLLPLLETPLPLFERVAVKVGKPPTSASISATTPSPIHT
ncbi:MAG: hypothetical protein ACJ8AW_55055 [Rhodopila sp.]